DLTDFKCKTQNLAFKVSFVLGIIVASFGIRTLAPLVEPNAFGKLPHLQQVGFAALDVLLTGALLSGGADGLHQVLSLFLDYVGKTRHRVPAAGQLMTFSDSSLRLSQKPGHAHRKLSCPIYMMPARSHNDS